MTTADMPAGARTERDPGPEGAGRTARSLPDLLLDQVRARPESLAVIADAAGLTFRALARRSTAVARHLRRIGVRPDSCVGLFGDPSVELMVGVWGILFAGGAYLPLSPEYPRDRLAYMIEDSGAAVIVTPRRLRAQAAALAPHGTTVVTVEDLWLGSTAADEFEIGPRPDQLAYVIYTSGSTGKPKGVMIEHGAIVGQLRWLEQTQGIDRHRIVLQKTPLSFDAAQWEMLAAACGSQVVMGPGLYRDPERLIAAVDAHGVTTLQCVPTLLQALLDTGKLSGCTSLVQVFSGGEALSRHLARRFVSALPGCTLTNLYGPTEATINASAFTVDRRSVADGAARAIPIGTPAHDTEFYLLDRDGRPVAPGEVGEIHIGGVQLARGYLHRPELTAEKFVVNPFRADRGHDRLYRTGDLGSWNADGTVQFAGRTDNQVKLRGFRVELDEIRLAIETHGWVRRAAAVVRDDPRTGSPNLVAFVELNPREAALMDQGNHGAHHLSKQGRLQTRAQLSNDGCRTAAQLRGKPVVDLPGKQPSAQQWRRVFARKTYRFFDGGEVTKADILRLLGQRVAGAPGRDVATLTGAGLGEILRYFGQYVSTERLLPKYGYASPGALYATQLYLEIDGVAGLRPGFYYYHPVRHQLMLIRAAAGSAPARLRVHFVGRRRAVEPVYRNNIQEVLEIEAGHMVGLFERVLPRHGLDIRAHGYAPGVREHLECAEDDHYLGTFEVVPFAGTRPEHPADVYVQAHPGKVGGLPAGLYRYADGALEAVGDDIVLQRHVIAINQQVYRRSSFGVSLVSRPPAGWLSYLELGRRLHHLQSNDARLGLMSSGYSSKTGDDLPSAQRLAAILHARGLPVGPSYFAVGGRVSDEQLRSIGMNEDVVHMKGPTEIIRDDLITFLPDYMLPNRVVVLDRLPLTPNSKIDTVALAGLELPAEHAADRPHIAPRTPTEARIRDIWKQVMRRAEASVRDDFFASGGDSLIAVSLINRINRQFRSSLPLQVLFEAPTIEQLSRRVDDGTGRRPARLVPLRPEGTRSPVFCWPGLGGYVMNLRPLAERVELDRPFFGVLAYGINKGETPYAGLSEMAAADIEVITRVQPQGPYTLWGYSFGARVAFEAAYQLERSGRQVENLFLIAPGSPQGAARGAARGGPPSYADRTFLAILFSVFGGTDTGARVAECLDTVVDRAGFIAFVVDTFPHLDADLVARIVRIVEQTYPLDDASEAGVPRRIEAPVTIFPARGDAPSPLADPGRYPARAPEVIDLPADHYGVLTVPGVDDLAAAVRHRLGVEAAAGR
ncbi:amino acid adenylation domain-containing protein [Actinoplanes sp. NPDC049118]|uniref:amino acid adenylation domain-containing protein n=1 Tax=Actinoplanes sp. NPDC049118 TaxID=3155769 RepID=UPI003404CE2F